MVKGLVVTVTGAMVGVGCSDDGGDAVAPTTGGEGTATGPTPAELLRQLEEDGDVAAFTDVYAASGDGVAPALLVGVSGASAVGYLCDPAGGGRWFTGEVDGDRLDLDDDDGGRLTGTIDGRSLDTTLAGAGDYDADYALTRTSTATLSRQAADDEGDGVGGLIVDGTTVTGSFGTQTFQLASPTSTSITVPTAVRGLTLGLRATADSQLRVDITVLTANLNLTQQQKQLLQERLAAVAVEIAGLERTASDAVAQAEEAADCAKTWAIVGAVVMVIVAVIIAVIAVVVAIFTGGGGGVIVGTVPIPTIRTALPTALALPDELRRILASRDPAIAGAAYIEANDPTPGKVISQTVRLGLARLGIVIGGATTTSSSTTTTTIPRRIPEPGPLTITVR